MEEKLSDSSEKNRELEKSESSLQQQKEQLENRIKILQIDFINKQDNLELKEGELQGLKIDFTSIKQILDGTLQRNSDITAGLSTQVSALQMENQHYRKALIVADKKVESTKNTLSFQLGFALIQAGKNWEGLKLLPCRLLTLYKLKKSGKFQAGKDTSRFEEKVILEKELENKLDALFINGGLDTCITFLNDKNSNITLVQKANAYTKLAKSILLVDVIKASFLARKAVELDVRPFRRKWLAFMLYDAGNIVEAYELLNSLDDKKNFKSSEKFKASCIEGSYQLLNNHLSIPEVDLNYVFSQSKRLLYVAASALPFHISGYTNRTHAILKTLTDLGIDVVCVTRPGYPDDRPDSLQSNKHDTQIIEGIRYDTVQGPNRRKVGLSEYIRQSTELLVVKAKELDITAIHAASNYENAIPAMFAARILGVPFIYEVRGLWEYTTASKFSGWENTEVFGLDKKLETFVAKNADHVLTLTNALADELIARGVDKHKIQLLPNAVDIKKFQIIPKDSVLLEQLNITDKDFILGYVGSLVGYEGLEDMVDAVAFLATQKRNVKCIIVGDGDVRAHLERKVNLLGLQEQVIFIGKVVPQDVNRYTSILDAVVLPRKPYTVCQLVSPLKPLEAMAMGIPVIASDVLALKEMLVENETGLIFSAGDVQSLSEAIIKLMDNPELKSQIIKNALDHVKNTRTWKCVVQSILNIYSTQIKNNVFISECNSVEVEPLMLAKGKNSMSESEKLEFDKKIQKALAIGTDSLKMLIIQQTEGHSDKFFGFCALKAANTCLNKGYIESALWYAEETLKKDRSISTLRGVIRIYANATEIDLAEQLAKELTSLAGDLSNADKRFVNEIFGRKQLIEWAKMPTVERKLPVIKKCVLNVLAFSLPYTSVGYATRSHGLAQGISNAGWEIIPYTRPGFPYDFKTELEGQELPLSDVIDGITYRRIFDIERRGQNETEYLLECIKHWEDVIEQEKPEVIHAASNYVTALPVLIAARRKGIPFVYEVRGFWEVTRSSRDEDFINTSKYLYMQLFESLVAKQADRIITITMAMKEELIKRGVSDALIEVAYNSVDPERFIAHGVNHNLAKKLGIPSQIPVIGYVGSFVDYEGLDDLIDVANDLKKEGIDFRLLMVGDGAVFESLQQQVDNLGLEDKVILTGRVPHDEVEEYYSLIDIAPFPRKPWEVCELVSPLKPFEAMALKKAVVVSSTRALIEIIQDGYNGLVFEKGNTSSLKDVLKKLITSSELRNQLGKNAREWIIKERSWNVAGEVCANCYCNTINTIEGNFQ
ncbi:MAG: glycosyltransferase [Campylobacteraceae bacterium]|nr:glycosyltransferase [Campylobacteraceae bacterium]